MVDVTEADFPLHAGSSGRSTILVRGGAIARRRRGFLPENDHEDRRNIVRSMFSLMVLGIAGGLAWAADPPPERIVPATRPEMKKLLEELKKSTPRLPLKPLTAEEKKKQGDRPVVNNGRLRQIYLPAELRDQGYSREPDPKMTLDNTFKVMLFWLVSRGNNCHY
jgi:hypothetical protein